MHRVIMKYHVKSGASSLKIDWVMLYLDLVAIFYLVVILFFGKKLWTTIQNLELIAWKLTELCSIYFLPAILFFGGHFVFWRRKAELSLWTTMQKSGAYFGSHFVFWIKNFYFLKKKFFIFCGGSLWMSMEFWASSLKTDWVIPYCTSRYICAGESVSKWLP